MKINNKELEEKIISLATDYIFTQGATGWNMDKLAASSGIVKNTLYKIIPSKEALIEKILQSHLKNIQFEFTRIVDSEPDFFMAAEKTIVFLTELFSTLYSQAMKNIFLEYPSIEERVHEMRKEFFEEFIKFIKIGINTQHLKSSLDPELLFELFQAVVLYYIKYYEKEGRIPERMRESFLYILEGIKR